MALTAEKVKDLEARGFQELFQDHRALWRAKAGEAYTYAASFVRPSGEPVRPDDLLPLLVPALVLVKEFRVFLDDKRLTQKYWRTHFAEFIIDRLWDELTSGEETR